MERTALITGANRGIGLEVCRQLAESGLRVVLTARSAELGEEAAHSLVRNGASVIFELPGVSSDESVMSCAERLGWAKVRVDVLVNNAFAVRHLQRLEGSIECVYAEARQRGERQDKGERSVSRVGAHAHGRPDRATLDRAGCR